MSAPTFTDDEVVTAFPDFTVHTPNIGVGKQKIAFKAEDRGSDVALKIMLVSTEASDDEAASATERFNREMVGMSATSCPHVVPLLRGPEVREIGGSRRFWYLEPLLVGGTLKRRIANGPMAMEECLKLAVALLDAVDAMWNEGRFVHRDIKPSNIGYLADGTVVLLDLGVALFVEMPDITESQMSSPGTDRYAAPEQFEFRRLAQIDFRTDLFQVGIVLAEAVTGSHPFFELGTDYMHKLTNFDPATLDPFGVPKELRALIVRLLAPRPSGRFRTVEQAKRALQGGT